MGESSKHNMTPILDAKDDSPAYVYEEYFSLRDFRQHPVNEKFKSELARRMVAWADKDDSRVLINFYNSETLYEKTVHRWMETNEDLRKAHEYAKQRIAGRLMDGAITKAYSENIVKWSLPLYYDAVKELEEWRAKIGEKVDGATQVNVYMDKFPDSPKVTKRANNSE